MLFFGISLGRQIGLSVFAFATGAARRTVGAIWEETCNNFLFGCITLWWYCTT